MTLKKAYWALGLSAAGAYVLCGVDGVLETAGGAFLSPGAGNALTVLLFGLLAALLTLGCVRRSPAVLGRVGLAAGIVLGGLVVLMLAQLGLSALHAPAGVRQAALCAAMFLSAPMAACSVMAAPVFAWACVLVTSWTLRRRLRRNAA